MELYTEPNIELKSVEELYGFSNLGFQQAMAGNYGNFDSLFVSGFQVAPLVIPLADWTPSLLKTDKATALTGTLVKARYMQISKLVVGELQFTGILDPIGGAIYVTPLPVAAESSAAFRVVGNGYSNMGAGTSQDSCTIGIVTNDTNYFVIQRRNTEEWGTAGYFSVVFQYFTA